MRLIILLLLIATLFALTACRAEPPTPTGPTLGALPLMEGSSEIEEVPLVLRTIEQAHKETVRQPAVGFYRTATPFIDTIDWYDNELRRMDWGLVDVLEFGDGGFVRRYHRDQQRAILAFHPAPEEGEGAEYVLIQGDVK